MGKNGWVSALSRAVSGKGGVFLSLPVLLMVGLASCQSSPAEPFAPKIVSSGESRDNPRSLSKNLTTAIDVVLDSSLAHGGGPEKVLVPKFMDNRGVARVLGRYLASRIGEGLSQDPSLKVMDAGKLRQQMHLEGITQGGEGSSSMLKIAKELGADRLVLGRLTDLGQKIEVSARILSVSTGEVLGQVSQVVQKNGSFLNLWDVGP